MEKEQLIKELNHFFKSDLLCNELVNILCRLTGNDDRDMWFEYWLENDSVFDNDHCETFGFDEEIVNIEDYPEDKINIEQLTVIENIERLIEFLCLNIIGYRQDITKTYWK